MTTDHATPAAAAQPAERAGYRRCGTCGRAAEAAARLQHRADTEPSWAYIRDRASRWCMTAAAAEMCDCGTWYVPVGGQGMCERCLNIDTMGAGYSASDYEPINQIGVYFESDAE